ncbi:Subtilisin-like protease SBT1.7 [Linum grandiflorum]
MATLQLQFHFLHLLLLLLLPFSHLSTAEKQTYIVQISTSQLPATTPSSDGAEWYESSLRSVSTTAELLYTYTHAIHGFSTRLTPREAQLLQSQPGILSVTQESIYHLHTTRSPAFLGLDLASDLLPQANTVGEVVVGVLDTGAWPESRSYDDAGFGPVPSSWKGKCEVGTNFTVSHCNRKLIGARFFARGYEESRSPRDDDGHGTHTSTTAAGSAVDGASLFGFAAGTARGMATRARVAVYKVCWMGGCFSSDILAAMDVAIQDGVNVLSMSLGGGTSDYYRDSVAIGAFSAMEKGILVSCSAGNSGPTSYSLSNVAPWITTVGAGTMDRDFPAMVRLGNGKNYSGVSLYKGSLLNSKPLPFVYAANASNATNGNLCMIGTLIPEKVKGKIVLCDRKGSVVKEAGGLGMVLANTAANGEELVADAHLLPTAAIGQKNGDEIKRYLLSDRNPTATILIQGTKLGVQPSPVVAAFSSRGPNTITPEILKPDLIAPGVNILAGWTGKVGPTGLAADPRRVEFNIISGTSMSCPHVAGLAALVKAAHPEWSPAAVRSALMTTAYVSYKDGNDSTPFDHGAGHVDPVSALNPGLVYDLTAEDYLSFLCALNYTELQINTVARRNYTCDPKKKHSVADFNYPSFAVNVDTTQIDVVKHTRTVTNVGASGGVYKVSVTPEQIPGVKIVVEPETLSFKEANEKKGYTVTFMASSMAIGTNRFARLEWSDGKHVAGSSIAVSWS